jgi:serine/threonine protein phosphatase PrpC
MSHNPGLSFRLDFADFPLINTVDLFGTDVRHNTPGLLIRELVTNDAKCAEKSAQFRFYCGRRFGYSETIGRRPSMEDSLIIRESDKPNTPSLYGVIDGHGGFESSALSAYLIPIIFDKTDPKSISEIPSIIKEVNDRLSELKVKDGATLVLALVAPQWLGIAHLGDARAIIVKRDGYVTHLTNDHKPTDRSELDALRGSGAFIQSGRLDSSLAVSRAIGDFQVDGLFRIPDLKGYDVGEDDFRLVLACDGVFDVMDNEDVGGIVAECADVNAAAVRVRNEAVVRGSGDNVSVIVVDSSGDEC